MFVKYTENNHDTFRIEKCYDRPLEFIYLNIVDQITRVS